MIKYSYLPAFLSEMEKCGKCGDCAAAVEITSAKKHINKPCVIKNVLGFEAYDARGRILLLKRLLDGTLTINEELLDWAYLCLLCGNCQETCLAIDKGINLPSMMEAFRRDLIENGINYPKHLEIIEKTFQHNNPYGEPHKKRFNFILSENFPEKAEIVVFFGCTAAYRQQNIANATFKLLKKANIEFTVLKEEKCCGSVLLRYGYNDRVKVLAKDLIDQIQKSGAKTVIFPCAGCYRTFKVDYPQLIEMPDNVELIHIVEFLERLVKENKIHFRLKNTQQISYHDPCHLGRAVGVFESPRFLINSIQNANLVEMETRRNYSHCCGAGGGVKSCFPEISLKVGQNRIIEASQNKIDYLVSACPFCKTNLAQGLNGHEFQVLDLTELLSQTIDESLTGSIVKNDSSIIENSLTADYISYLSNNPEIFSDLSPDSVLDFTIYDSIDAFEDELPHTGAFHVKRLENKIEIHSGLADNADLQLALSEGAVKELIKSKEKQGYSHKFGKFYNDPEDEFWIDFVLHKRTKTLLKMGYGKFAEEAGILDEDEEDLEDLDERVKINLKE
ncbi:MAG TPA: (Fe-S)-binding protein [Candidatus Deferrimicrobium sp.]|nr:(Fe-S)-binding protein [Candidatus Deferrimicrobium sp.]